MIVLDEKCQCAIADRQPRDYYHHANNIHCAYCGGCSIEQFEQEYRFECSTDTMQRLKVACLRKVDGKHQRYLAQLPFAWLQFRFGKFDTMRLYECDPQSLLDYCNYMLSLANLHKQARRFLEKALLYSEWKLSRNAMK